MSEVRPDRSDGPSVGVMVSARGDGLELRGAVVDDVGDARPELADDDRPCLVVASETASGTVPPGIVTAGDDPGTADCRSLSRLVAGRLRLRLFGLDTVSVIVCWIVLSFVLAGRSTMLVRLAPGAAGAAATLLAILIAGLYQSRVCAKSGAELLRTASACLVGATAFVVVEWQVAAADRRVLICLISCAFVTAGSRRVFGRWIRAQRAQGRFRRGVVLVGANDDTARLRTLLRSEPELGYVVTGVVGSCNGDPVWQDIPSTSSLTNIPRMATLTGATGIMIVPNALSGPDIQRAITVASAAKLHVQVWPGLAGVGSRRLRLVPMSGEAFFYVEPRRSRRWELAAKRAIDLVGATAACLLTAPVLVVAAVLILLDSPGPVLHRAERIGLHGKPFVTYKLRTMRAGGGELFDLAGMNERVDGPLFKSSLDPRVTRVGRWLRLSSIDELPQLWNVLMGTMSLVGPRPALPGEVAQFDQELLRRHCVRPGITGLWQIEARRNPSFNAYRRLDLSYVDNWSLGLDLSILAATGPSVISHTMREIIGHRRV